MNDLDAKIYEAIKSTPKTYYNGCDLNILYKRFVRPSKNIYEEDIWAALSRLSQQKRIKKSGSHRYKSYTILEPQNVPTTSW